MYLIIFSAKKESNARPVVLSFYYVYVCASCECCSSSSVDDGSNQYDLRYKKRQAHLQNCQRLPHSARGSAFPSRGWNGGCPSPFATSDGATSIGAMSHHRRGGPGSTSRASDGADCIGAMSLKSLKGGPTSTSYARAPPR